MADIFDEYLSPSGTSEPLPGLDEQVVAADDAGHTFISKGRNGRRAAELYSLGKKFVCNFSNEPEHPEYPSERCND